MTDDADIARFNVIDLEVEQLAAYPAFSTAELAKLQDSAVIVRSHGGIVLGRIAPGDAKAVMMEVDKRGGSPILSGLSVKGGAAVVTYDRQSYAQR